MSTTIQVFATQSRAPATYTSPTAAWDGATDTGVFYIPTCSQANWAAFVGTLSATIEQSLDSEATWELVASAAWSGNVWGRGGPPTMPSASFQARFDTRGPRRVRANLIVVGATLTVGLSATFNTLL